jgi:hypothetical protein
LRLSVLLNPDLSRMKWPKLDLDLSRQLTFQLIRQLCPILSPNLSLIPRPWLSLNVSLESTWKVTLLVSGQLNPNAPGQTRGQSGGMPRAGPPHRFQGAASRPKFLPLKELRAGSSSRNIMLPTSA